ncbi:MAG TPA: PEP-CTERM sorting domain-containing protein [Phycisphaerae bacterium]|nr:PEP-CTERM sorting domain-containing protein [Phycisphaerae bacterium]
MKKICLVAGGFLALAVAAPVSASTITIDLFQDGGGENADPLNGLAARATFESSGPLLTILLQNTSSGIPDGFSAADSLLVSLGMNLPTGVVILSGDSASIGVDSVGLAEWSTLRAGDNVNAEWAWTNAGGGDLLESFAQVITTSQGNHGLTSFGGGKARVGGPFGGIAPNPLIRSIPNKHVAVSNSIEFVLTLSDVLSQAELQELALGSIVEFGSDQRYLYVPEPASLVLFLAGMIVIRRSAGRRRTV